MISFFVPGIAKPAGSKRGFPIKDKRTGKTRVVITDDCKTSGDWKADVKAFAAQAYQGELLTGPIHLSLGFRIGRPKSHFRTGKRSHELRDDAPLWVTKKPDVLKLARAVEDAMTGVVWVDDAQIAVETLSKLYGDTPGVQVMAYEITDEFADTIQKASER